MRTELPEFTAKLELMVALADGHRIDKLIVAVQKCKRFVARSAGYIPRAQIDVRKSFRRRKARQVYVAHIVLLGGILPVQQTILRKGEVNETKTEIVDYSRR